MGDKQNCFVNRKIKSLFLLLSRIILDFPDGSDGKASAYNAGDPGSIPGLERSSGEGNGNPLEDFLAWKIPWIEERGGLHPIGSKRVRHD